MNKSKGPGDPTVVKSILNASHWVDGRLEGALARHGLSMAKQGLLQVLADAGEPLPLGEIANRLACVKSNVTQLVDRLEADGLVQRFPAPEDRRCTLAAITEAGRQRYRSGLAAQEQAERDLLANLTADECRQLGLLLARLGAAENSPTSQGRG